MTIRTFKILNIQIIKAFVRTLRKESSPSQLSMPSSPVQMIDNSLVSPSSNRANEDILKQHTTSDDIKLYCIQYMRDETHSFEYTRAILQKLDLDARKEIEKLGGNKGLIAILDRLRVEKGNEVIV